jgi:hypothetical protein
MKKLHRALRIRQYDVLVCRTAYAHQTVRVQAASAPEAEKAALAFAGDVEFTTRDAEYSIEAVSIVRSRGK